MNKKILIVDDDFSLRTVMIKALSSKSIDVRSVSSVSEAWVLISNESFDLIICDVLLPDGDGLELVKKIKDKNVNQKIIIISAQNNIITAIKADELKVFEYLPKPIDLNDLVISVNQSLKDINKVRNNDVDFNLNKKLPMIGSSVIMQNVYKNIAKTTKTNFSVLITGESGTGKELVAQTIHNFSSRSKAPFIIINMASLPKDLIESELFGYEKGAFTGAEKQTLGFFEKASGGTIFLDEIGDMPFDVQARLLRVLQFGEFSRVGGREQIKIDVRVISATNKNLINLINQGEFRDDLYYRLNVINIDLPPLRRRDEDIISLANHFLTKYSNNTKKFDESGLNTLKNYRWPGNIRELENLIKKVSVLSTENLIDRYNIENLLSYGHTSSSYTEQNSKISNKKINLKNYLETFFEEFYESLGSEDNDLNLYEKFLSEFEKPIIIKTLKHCRGNQMRASKILGLNRNTLRSKMLKYKVPNKFGKIDD